MVFQCCFGGEERHNASSKSKLIDRDIKKSQKLFYKQIKLLLLGPGDSGKTTFMKQMKIINNVSFTSEELLDYKDSIYNNLFNGTKNVLCNLSQTLPNYNGFLTQINNYDNHISSIVTVLNQLSQESSFMNFLSSQYFMSSLNYFYNNLGRILNQNYVPNLNDILHCRKSTKSINEYLINIHDVPFRFVDVGGQKSQRQKWVQCFEGVTSILFFVDSAKLFSDMHLNNPSKEETIHENSICDDNGQLLQQEQQQKGLMDYASETLAIFETLINNRFFTEVSVILFLNKTDILEKIIGKYNDDEDKKLTNNAHAMHLTNPRHHSNNDLKALVVENNTNKDLIQNVQNTTGNANSTNALIVSNKKGITLSDVQTDIYNMFLTCRRDKNKPIFCHCTTAVDTRNIERVFEDVRNTLLDKNLRNITLS